MTNVIDTNEVVKKTIIAYTDGSTAPGNPGPTGFGFHATDNLGNVINGYGGVGLTSTNNIGELTAIIKLLKNLTIYKDIGKIDIYSDSKYALEGIKHIPQWVKKNWVTANYSPVKNQALFEEIYNLLNNEYKDIDITFNWCKGHNGIIGNELADKNANRGRLLAIGNIYEDIFDVTEAKEEIIEGELVSGKKVKKPKKIAIKPLHPLMTGKRWFFYTNQNHTLSDGRSFYTTTTYADPPDPKKMEGAEKNKHAEFVKKNRNIGKRAPDSHYSIFVTKEPIEELNSLRDKFNNHFVNQYLPIIVNLQTVTKSAIWEEMANTKNELTKIIGQMAVTHDDILLGAINNPPKLTFKLHDIFSNGFKLLDHYENYQGHYVKQDITQHLLMDEKDVQIINPELTQTDKYIDVLANIVTESIIDTIPVRLTLGLDLPLRNDFSALLKMSKLPIKVSLVLYELCEYGFRLATVVEHNETIGIYYSPEANYRFIKPHL